MKQLRAWFQRFGGLFDSERRDRELKAELESHLQMHIDDNLNAGLTPEEARRQALIKLGGLEQTKENYRDRRGLPLLETLIQDLRYGLRMLRKNPGFTAVAVLTLGLGIGANTAIFSVVNAVLLRPLPYRDPGRLVLFWFNHGFFGPGPGSVCDPDYIQWKSQNQVFDQMAAFRGQTANLTGGANPQRLLGSVVTASFFSTLGVQPALGRTFLPEEEQAGQENVVLLSHQVWEGRFGSNRGVLGEAITLDDKPYKVIGVMPAGFQFPNQADFWSPMVLSGDCHNATDQVIAHLKADVTPARAWGDVALIGHRLDQAAHRDEDGQGMGLTFVFLQDSMVGNIRPALLILLAAVGLVLLIACANVANLLMARSMARQREVTIRRIVGASRMRIVRQMLTESVLLAMLGGILGLLLAAWGRSTLVSLMPPTLAQPGIVSRMAAVNIDAWVLGFTLLVSVATGILFGVAPALQASKPDSYSPVKESGRGLTAGTRLRGVRRALIIGEFALTLILLSSAGLLIRSFVRLTAVKPGFDPQNVLTMNLTLPPTKYQTEAQMKAFLAAVLERVRALPGVKGAGTGFGVPLGSGGILAGDFEIEGQLVPAHGNYASKQVVSPGYLQALGIPLLEGREFSENDTATSRPVAIVNHDFARRFWPGGHAVGHRIRPFGSWYTIVGVVGDVRQWGLAQDAPLAIDLPYSQSPQPFFLSAATLVVRTPSDPLAMANAVRQEVQVVDPEMPVFDVTSMEQLVYRSVAEPRFDTLLLGSFAALALILASVGIYGVVSYSVTQRTHEIGIRMALGAERIDVLKPVVSEGLGLTLAGVGIGLIGALILTRFLANLLYGVRPTDLVTFVAVSMVLTGVAAFASYVPARRATRIDPMVALRYE
ncbi:MAG TPA: ABC transporter permease [Terriglobia bacterium]